MVKKRYIIIGMILLIFGIAWEAVGLDGEANNATDISKGGTNATTAAGARTSLGLVVGTDVLAPNGAGTNLTALNGENIQDDTIDDDSIDFTDITLNDFTFDVGSVDKTEFGYLNGVTSAIQTQINAIPDTAFTSLTAGDSYSNYGDADDDTIDELFDAIDTAIGGLGGGHDAVTLAAGVHTLTLSTQEIGIDATVEQLADLTPTNNAFLGFDGSGNLENKTTMDLQFISSAEFEGSSADDYETTLTVTDPTADRTVTFRDASGTVVISGDTFTGEVTATLDTDGSTALTIADNIIEEVNLEATNSPTDNYILSYDSASGGFTWVEASAGGGDSISIDSVAVVDPDFVSTGDIDFVDTSNTVTANLKDDVVGTAEMADADHGDFTYSGGTATIDDDAITTAKINTDAVTMDGIDADGTFQSLTGDWRTTGDLQGGVYTASYSSNQTLTAAQCYGGVIYVTGAATITLPAVADGASVTVITIGAVAVSVDPNASDKLWLDGTALDDGDKATNTSTTGDIIVLTYYSADGWYATSNSWTDGGA